MTIYGSDVRPASPAVVRQQHSGDVGGRGKNTRTTRQMRDQEILELLLRRQLEPYLDTATYIEKRVKRTRNPQPPYQLQLVVVTVLVTGIDKMLSVALELLYIAKKVNWKWIKPKLAELRKPGFISCGPGLTAKLKKLKEIGLDLTHLQWLVDLRHDYIHSCEMFAGYKAGISQRGKARLVIAGNGPIWNLPAKEGSTIIVQAAKIREDSMQLMKEVVVFLDRNKCSQACERLARRAKALPLNPQPEYGLITERSSLEEINELIDELNRKHIGIGYKKILYGGE